MINTSNNLSNTNLISSKDKAPMSPQAQFSAMLEEIKNFKEDLYKLGPAQFILKMNMEKIQDKIDEKRAELEATYDVENLNGEEKEKTLKMIEDFLAAYKKELLEQTKAQKELEEQAKKRVENNENSSSSMSLDVMKAFEILDSKSEQNKLKI